MGITEVAHRHSSRRGRSGPRSDFLLSILAEEVRRHAEPLASDAPVRRRRSNSEILWILDHPFELRAKGLRCWGSGSLFHVIRPANLVLSGADVLKVVGLAAWHGDRGLMTDPFAARFELTADLSAVRHYSLHLGHADFGLGRTPGNWRSNWHPPGRWCLNILRVPGAWNWPHRRDLVGTDPGCLA